MSKLTYLQKRSMWRARRGGWIRALSSGEHRTLDSLVKRGLLERRAWRFLHGTRYEYRIPQPVVSKDVIEQATKVAHSIVQRMRRRLLTYDQAVVTRAQHKRPCSDCPFSRKSIRGWVPDTKGWIESVHGEARMECHTKKTATGEAHQCAGAAIYRNNVHKSPRDASLLILPRDTRTVFASPQEFLDHHEGTKP